MHLALIRIALGNNVFPLLQKTGSLELPASETSAPQRPGTVADTSQDQLFRGQNVNEDFMVKKLQRSHY